jgi:hypothetical protein
MSNYYDLCPIEHSCTFFKLSNEPLMLNAGTIDMENRRKVKDRRAYNQEQDRGYPCNRRYRPCRRLNNISANWIPTATITRHPVISLMFRKLGYEKAE